MGYPERNVPDVTRIVRMLYLLATLTVSALPGAASNGDVNFTTVFVPHTNSDPAKVMMMRAGRVMMFWFLGIGVRDT